MTQQDYRWNFVDRVGRQAALEAAAFVLIGHPGESKVKLTELLIAQFSSSKSNLPQRLRELGLGEADFVVHAGSGFSEAATEVLSGVAIAHYVPTSP